mmetsp:Transcript_7387/g.19926  ORF Transcript_7387/g.19926 Transcript_7387/m.19926 type:complete len:227 (+) Transcript_7387:742-1422(+)
MLYLGCSLLLMPLRSRTMRHCMIPACFGTGSWRNTFMSWGGTLATSKEVWKPAASLGSNTGQMPLSFSSCWRLLRRLLSSSLLAGGAAASLLSLGDLGDRGLSASRSSSSFEAGLPSVVPNIVLPPLALRPRGDFALGDLAPTGEVGEAIEAGPLLSMLMRPLPAETMGPAAAMPPTFCFASAFWRCASILALMLWAEAGAPSAAPPSSPGIMEPVDEPAVVGRVP